MKALIFETAGDYREVLKLKEIQEPEMGDHEVRIKVKARPVNPSDLMFIKGRYRRKPQFPQIAGLEGSGVISETGAQVRHFKAGDHVAFRAPGTWAEEVVVNENDLIKIGRDLPFEVSAQLPLNGITAQAVLMEASLTKGDVLLINAANSSLAGLIIQLAAAKGIRVFALVRDLKNEQEIKELGAEQVLAQDDPQLNEILAQALGEIRFNAFIDSVGGGIVTRVLPYMAQYGTIVACGNMSAGKTAAIGNDQLIYKNLTIKGFGIDRWLSLNNYETIHQFYEGLVEDLYTGRLRFRKTAVVTLEISNFDLGDKVIIVS